jgi:hypothetical protein
MFTVPDVSVPSGRKSLDGQLHRRGLFMVPDVNLPSGCESLDGRLLSRWPSPSMRLPHGGGGGCAPPPPCSRWNFH